jgi:hypothetical protein
VKRDRKVRKWVSWSSIGASSSGWRGCMRRAMCCVGASWYELRSAHDLATASLTWAAARVFSHRAAGGGRARGLGRRPGRQRGHARRGRKTHPKGTATSRSMKRTRPRSRSRMPASSGRSAFRSWSTSATCRRRSARCTERFAQAAGCWCGTSIGPPCPGTRSIGS